MGCAICCALLPPSLNSLKTWKNSRSLGSEMAS